MLSAGNISDCHVSPIASEHGADTRGCGTCIHRDGWVIDPYGAIILSLTKAGDLLEVAEMRENNFGPFERFR